MGRLMQLASIVLSGFHLGCVSGRRCRDWNPTSLHLSELLTSLGSELTGTNRIIGLIDLHLSALFVRPSILDFLELLLSRCSVATRGQGGISEALSLEISSQGIHSFSLCFTT